ncbi:hypothetical protein TanjilG_21037 [Lupinus angustifolius]|uniref:Uncharacterized protein n=1 Tax=Lupinus angustifolius TaxID=3871 RepID=A0A394DC43_LUPAN|nr:hypothetical protein TanjilG_21037 [Lupinus angustifolius]
MAAHGAPASLVTSIISFPIPLVLVDCRKEDESEWSSPFPGGCGSRFCGFDRRWFLLDSIEDV